MRLKKERKDACITQRGERTYGTRAMTELGVVNKTVEFTLPKVDIGRGDDVYLLDPVSSER